MIKEEKIFRFYIFDKLLKKSMSELNASETHGMIIASICVNNSEAMLEDFILNFLGVQQNQKIITSFIKKLREYNNYQLKSLNSMLFLMIPDQEDDLFVNMKHLQLWLKGFISGLGLFGLTEKQCSIPVIYEIINDFSMIIRIKSLNDQKDEIYYFDLLEYVKISVEIIYFEIRKFEKK